MYQGNIEVKGTLKTEGTMTRWIRLIVVASLMTGCIARFEAANPPLKRTTQNTEFMLSFDDGPLPDKTERVLDILATLMAIDGTPVKAGFFLLADSPDDFWQQQKYYAPYELWTDKGSMTKYPNIARLISLAGHTIGNHSTHHGWVQWPWLDTSDAVLQDFTEWEAISNQVVGASSVRLFRPPYLVLSTTLRETARQLGYQIVLGEVVDDAIPGITVAEIKNKTVSILTAWNESYPCVLIFHDNRPTTYQHLGEIVSHLQQQGFRLVHFDSKRL